MKVLLKKVLIHLIVATRIEWNGDSAGGAIPWMHASMGLFMFNNNLEYSLSD